MNLGYKIFERQGRVAFCGAYSQHTVNSVFTDDFNTQALAAAQVRLAGETLLRGLNFFALGGYVADGLPSAQATCVLTDRPWEARFARTKPRIRW
ncbi:MAG: hypothetical protein AAFN27_04685, partial [Pseudomonadota bacterium]